MDDQSRGDQRSGWALALTALGAAVLALLVGAALIMGLEGLF